MSVQAALEELPKSRQKDLLRGRTFISQSNDAELDELLVEIAKASE
jgi:hypothetical protein